MEKKGISQEILADIIKLAKIYKLNQVILFGSRARGDFHRTSDINLAVSGGDITAFALDVEEEIPTLLKFDVVNLDMSVQQELLDSINREGKVIYEKI